MGSPAVAASSRKSPSSNRRTNKPLVEKKRRARINGCLGQLKSLILNAMKTEGTQVSRLEKADILEMTVKYLRHIQHQQVAAVTMTSEPEVIAKFSAGYTECAAEVIRYMDSVTGVTSDVRSRLESHLVGRLRGATGVTARGPQQPLVPSSPPRTGCQHQTSASCVTSSSDELSAHYQTAVDLANMAAAVTASEPAASCLPRSPEKTITLSSHLPQSSCPPSDNIRMTPTSLSSSPTLSPASGRHQSGGKSVSPPAVDTVAFRPASPLLYDAQSDARARHDSGGSDSSFSSAPYSPPSYFSRASPAGQEMQSHHDLNNNNTSNTSFNASTKNGFAPAERTGTDGSVMEDSNNNNTYLAPFQRPLHIHIPDSPTLTPSPPPPRQASAFAPHPPSNSVAARMVLPNGTDPTILYGVATNFQDVGVNPHMAYHHQHHHPGAPALLNSNTSMNNTYSSGIPTTSGGHYATASNYETTTAPPNLSDEILHESRHTPTPRSSSPSSPPTLVREEPFPTPSSVNSRNHAGQAVLLQPSSYTCEERLPGGSDNLRSTVSNYNNVRSRTLSGFQQYRPNNGLNTARIAGEIPILSQGRVHHHPQPHPSSHHPPYHPHHRAFSHPSSSTLASGECLGMQTEINNNGPDLNGIGARGLPPASRQNEKLALSPPALKRSRLSGQGSEFPAPSRCTDAWTSEERGGGGHAKTLVTGLHLLARTGPAREKGPHVGAGTASVACIAPAHSVVSSDESLWRPW